MHFQHTMHHSFVQPLLTLILLIWMPLAQAEQNILIFGDSFSACFGVAREACWTERLQRSLQQQHLPFKVVNASISGETTAGGMQRIAATLAAHHPAVVIFELGLNDALFGNSLAGMRANLSALITQAQHANARVVLVGTHLPPGYNRAYAREFQDAFLQLAQSHQVTLLPVMLEGITTEQLQADRFHPAEAAQTLILNNVLQALRPLLN